MSPFGLRYPDSEGCQLPFVRIMGEFIDVALGTGQGNGRGPHPLEAEMRKHPAALRPGLRSVHPRVFVTADELRQLQTKSRVRTKATRQARLLAEHYTLKPGKLISYSQNHVSIPLAGLAVAAYALWDEEPDAAQ